MENIGVFLFDAQDLSFSLFLFILRINRIVIFQITQKIVFSWSCIKPLCKILSLINKDHVFSLHENKLGKLFYIVGAKNEKLMLINQAMIKNVARSLQIVTLNNRLIAEKHTYWQLQFILRPLEIVHHSCECTKRCKKFVLMFERYIAIIWIALNLFWSRLISKDVY